jgi:hypothetical protein
MNITKLSNGGELHEYDSGNKYWYLNGDHYREDGPAIEWVDGGKEWLLNNKWHRENGPAIEYIDGTKEWYINDKRILCKTQEEFERLMKLKAFW